MAAYPEESDAKTEVDSANPEDTKMRPNTPDLPNFPGTDKMISSKERTDKDIEKTAVDTGLGQAAPADPNLVSWDGPDDPANPRNWSYAFKMANIGLISASVLSVNLATTMFAPGANVMQADFGYKSNTVELLTISIASLGFALGQMFIGPMSEVFGRVPIYRACSVFYLGFTAGCSRSTNVAEFLVFRLLTGVSASCFMTTGGGTVADLLPKEERGTAMALFTAGPILGPVIGPIIGGFVAQRLGWNWTFYLILILAGTIFTLCFFIMRETSTVILLRAKVQRLQKETGNPDLRAAGDAQIPVAQLFRRAIVRPVKFLVMSPIVLSMSLYQGLLFGTVMLLFATFPLVYEETYHWSTGVSGLAYIGVGVGSTVGVLLFAKLSDRLVRDKADGTSEYCPERRLILMMYATPLMPITLFMYGWTTYYKVHWVVPIIATAIGGPGVILPMSSTQTYMLDIFGPQAAASALGAVTLLRNLTGAFLPLCASSLYKNLGLGWGNSLLGFLTLAFAPLPFVLFWRGAALRQRFSVEA